VDRLSRTALIGCLCLVGGGGLLVLADFNAVMSMTSRGTAAQLVVLAEKCALWKWGLVCIISGVLGLVALAIGRRGGEGRCDPDG
jgi:hypothetical protein